MHFLGWLQRPGNTVAAHHSPSFGRLSPAREKHGRWPYSQAKLQQQFLTQKVLVHLRLQSTIILPVNGRKIMPSKSYSCLLKSSLSRMDENIKLLQPSRKKFTKVPKNKDMQFLTSRFRWLSATFKILTFSLSDGTTSLLQNRCGNLRHLWIADIQENPRPPRLQILCPRPDKLARTVNCRLSFISCGLIHIL